MEIIKQGKDDLILLKSLPADLQAKIKKLAQLDILKDEAKHDIVSKSVNVDLQVDKFLKSKTPNTRRGYGIALNTFFTFLKQEGIASPLLTKAEHVDSFVSQLTDTLKANSVIVTIRACSSFYSQLRRYGYIANNPFLGAKLPKKEYKKAITTNSTQSIPIMNDIEYTAILDSLAQTIKAKGNHNSIALKRQSSIDLSLAVQTMATYGLRVGALETLNINNNTGHVRTKGKDFSFTISSELSFDSKQPFKNIKTSKIQKAFYILAKELYKQGKLRHTYTCHDLRHYFAKNHYAKHNNPLLLKQALGHASLNITDIYLQTVLK